MRIPRPRSFRVPLSDTELAELHAISEHHRTDAATLVRQWIAREHASLFGAKKPSTAKRGKR